MNSPNICTAYSCLEYCPFITKMTFCHQIGIYFKSGNSAAFMAFPEPSQQKESLKVRWTEQTAFIPSAHFAGFPFAISAVWGDTILFIFPPVRYPPTLYSPLPTPYSQQNIKTYLQFVRSDTFPTIVIFLHTDDYFIIKLWIILWPYLLGSVFDFTLISMSISIQRICVFAQKCDSLQRIF